MEQEEIINEIRSKSSDLQTEFIMNLVRLCDEYGVKKTEFIRDIVGAMYQLVTDYNFDQLKA